MVTVLGPVTQGPPSPPSASPQRTSYLPETPSKGPKRRPRRHLADSASPDRFRGHRGVLRPWSSAKGESVPLCSGTGTTIETRFHALRGWDCECSRLPSGRNLTCTPSCNSFTSYLVTEFCQRFPFQIVFVLCGSCFVGCKHNKHMLGKNMSNILTLVISE